MRNRRSIFSLFFVSSILSLYLHKQNFHIYPAGGMLPLSAKQREREDFTIFSIFFFVLFLLILSLYLHKQNFHIYPVGGMLPLSANQRKRRFHFEIFVSFLCVILSRMYSCTPKSSYTQCGWHATLKAWSTPIFEVVPLL